jgi:hypothetical protein
MGRFACRISDLGSSVPCVGADRPKSRREGSAINQKPGAAWASGRRRGKALLLRHWEIWLRRWMPHGDKMLGVTGRRTGSKGRNSKRAALKRCDGWWLGKLGQDLSDR